MDVIKREQGLSNIVYSFMRKIIIKKYKNKNSKKIKKKRKLLERVLPERVSLPRLYFHVGSIEIREYVKGHFPENGKDFKELGKILAEIHENGKNVNTINIESYLDVFREDTGLFGVTFLKKMDTIDSNMVSSKKTVILEDCGKYNWIIGNDNNFFFLDYERVCTGEPAIDVASIILGNPEYTSNVLDGYEKRGYVDPEVLWKAIILKAAEVYYYFYRRYGAFSEDMYKFLRKYKTVLQYSKTRTVKNKEELMDVMIDISL